MQQTYGRLGDEVESVKTAKARRRQIAEAKARGDAPVSCAACCVARVKEEMYQCARCPAIYCSRECQAVAWRAHKKVCGGKK
jgi:hypothetical protein